MEDSEEAEAEAGAETATAAQTRAHCLVRTPASLPGAAHRSAEAAEAGGAHSPQAAEGRGAPGA